MLVDFTELRNRVLAGEEDAEAEATPSTLSIETTGNNITLAALLVGGGVLAVRMLDRIKYEGKIFQPDESGTDYGKFVSVAFGWIPLAFGLGRVSRGVKAQEEIGKYETLVTEAENFVTEMEAEMEVKEAEASWRRNCLHVLGHRYVPMERSYTVKKCPKLYRKRAWCTW